LPDHSKVAVLCALGGILILLGIVVVWGNGLTLLRSMVVGKDKRVSTSQAVALAWTFTIVFMFLALMIAKWLGNPEGWNALDNHLLPSYLLFLGGPYAAHAAAKTKAASLNKAAAAVGTPSVGDLIADDSGDTDLADFQYVVFNALTIIYVVVTFAGHLQAGPPDISPVLVGLALTSAGTYSVNKLVVPQAPSMVRSVAAAAAPLRRRRPSARATDG
jgi:hypothetical protein